MAAKAIAVITKSGWDTPALRMATKTHHPEFEQMQRKDNALRDAASEIDILRKRNVIQLMYLVAESERLSHKDAIDAFHRAQFAGTEDQLYWFLYVNACQSAIAISQCEECAWVSTSYTAGVHYQYMYDFSDDYVAQSNNERSRVANHKKFPCTNCPNAITALGNRLEAPDKHDTKAWRDGMIHMLRVVALSQ
jgi:hypothetical protein